MAGEEGESLAIFQEKLTSTFNYCVDTSFTTVASTPLDTPRCHEQPFDSANILENVTKIWSIFLLLFGATEAKNIFDMFIESC